MSNHILLLYTDLLRAQIQKINLSLKKRQKKRKEIHKKIITPFCFFLNEIKFIASLNLTEISNDIEKIKEKVQEQNMDVFIHH